MSEITLNDLPDQNWLIQLKKYYSNSENVIFDYRREQDDGYGLLYFADEVLVPYLEADSADSSVIYFMVQVPDQGLRIYSARNQNFPLEPFPDLYGYNFVYQAEYGIDLRIHELFESLVFSGVNEFIPPPSQKDLVYDFKFLKSDGDYIFPELEAANRFVTELPTSRTSVSSTTGASTTSGASSGGSSGGGY